MNHLFRAGQVLECASSSGLKRSPLLDEQRVGLRDVELCRRAKGAITIVEHDAKLGFAHARCVLQHGPEYRLQIAGRLADDLQHLVGRCLPLQRLAQLALRQCELAVETGVGHLGHRVPMALAVL